MTRRLKSFCSQCRSPEVSTLRLRCFPPAGKKSLKFNFESLFSFILFLKEFLRERDNTNV